MSRRYSTQRGWAKLPHLTAQRSQLLAKAARPRSTFDGQRGNAPFFWVGPSPSAKGAAPAHHRNELTLACVAFFAAFAKSRSTRTFTQTAAAFPNRGHRLSSAAAHCNIPAREYAVVGLCTLADHLQQPPVFYSAYTCCRVPSICHTGNEAHLCDTFTSSLLPQFCLPSSAVALAPKGQPKVTAKSSSRSLRDNQ